MLRKSVKRRQVDEEPEDFGKDAGTFRSRNCPGCKRPGFGDGEWNENERLTCLNRKCRVIWFAGPPFREGD